jgi:hypothetical protein
MNESQFQKTNGEVAAKFNLGKKVVLILCWRLGVLQNLNCCEISEGTKTNSSLPCTQQRPETPTLIFLYYTK